MKPVPCVMLLLLFAVSQHPFRAAEMQVTDGDRKHWSFLPLREVELPAVKSAERISTEVDRFILQQLEAKRLALSQQAEPLTLVRRIYYDLIGLPPTPTQADDFLADAKVDAKQAVRDLIDELLASPHYGERWGRHWLDVARYADSNGQEGDQDRPTAYHYRDFVIRALNEDMPFDQFVRWQIAGDELEPDNPLAIAATGFIVAGPHTVLDVPMEEEKIRNRFNELDDMIATTGSAMLGLTIGCARCHDHKYDAIPTRDYYRMLSAFNSGNRHEVPLASLEEARKHRLAEAEWKRAMDRSKAYFEKWTRTMRDRYADSARLEKITALPIGEADKRLLRDGDEALKRKHEKALKVDDKDIRSLLTDDERAQWDSLSEELKQVEDRKPKGSATALAFADYAPTPKENFLLARGDFRARKEPAEFGVLRVLTRGREAVDYWKSALADKRRDDSTQQRRALAEWITDVDHGAGMLAARVIVNRLWQHHFGEGLVRTVNDFGTQSEPPSHPELLEWLASTLVKNGWRLKPIHRVIVNSSAYLQDTRYDEQKAAVDPDNRLFWRRRPLRLEAEILLDAILATSGTLNPQMFGPAFKPPIAPEAIHARNLKSPYPKDAKDSPETRRRAIYMFHKRVVQHPLMQAFDGPDAAASCGRRESTTVAPQALALLNDSFVRLRAGDFAQRLVSEAGEEPRQQVTLAWRLALSRAPTNEELGASLELLDQQRARRSGNKKAEHLALTDFCQAVFALNEFVYVD